MTFKEAELIASTIDPITLNGYYSFMKAGPQGQFLTMSSSMGINNEFLIEIEDTWELAIQSEEAMLNSTNSTNSTGGSLRRNLKLPEELGESTKLSPFFPFLVCMRDGSGGTKKKSGSQRLNSLIAHLNITVDAKLSNTGTNSPVYPMFNTDDKSCFGFRALASEAEKIATLSEIMDSDDDFTVIPFTTSMKIRKGSMEEVLNRVQKGWFAKVQEDNVFSKLITKDTEPLEFSLKFSPGVSDGTAITANSLSANIVSSISTLVQSIALSLDGTAQNRRRGLRRSQSQDDMEKIKSQTSFIQLFTSLLEQGSELQESQAQRTLQEGYCDYVLNNISYKTHASGDSFLLKINPSLEVEDADRTTRCVLLIIAAASYQPEILSISVVPKFTVFNSVAKSIVQGARDEPYLPFHDAGIDGTGQVVAVSDTGLDVDNCYFYDADGEVPKNGDIDLSKRKVVQYFPVDQGEGFLQDDFGGHGTHVCGTLAGRMSRDGITEEDGKYDGVAPKAKIAFLDLSPWGDFLNPPSDPDILFGTGRKAGARTHTCSWGAQIGLNTYNTYSSVYDDYLYENQDMVVIVASGNFGFSGVSFPGTAKNVITVGATINEFGSARSQMLDMSGFGKVEGNRKKPDLVAPGSFVGSAYSGGICDDVLWKEGTSMATPVVAGAVVLIQQYFADGFFPGITQPSAPLVKAILTNGGQLISGAPYDIKQNFGLASLIDSLPLRGKNNLHAFLFDQQKISNGETFKHIVTIDKSDGCAAPLSATLVWADPGSSAFLLNDLDLTMEKETSVYHPNGLNGRDEMNNVERIRIENVEWGERYLIRVSAHNLMQNDFKYSLVITGCFDDGSGATISSAHYAKEAPIHVENDFSNDGDPVFFVPLN